MTGRGAGYCAGYGVPGYANPVFGRGFGRSQGFGGSRGFGGGGRGWRHRFHATGVPGWMRFGGHAVPYLQSDPELEKQPLKSQAEAMQAELDAISKRLAELETSAASK